MKLPRHFVLFSTIVLLCTAQLSWWVLFQWQEAQRLQLAGSLLSAGDSVAALEALGGSAESGGLTEAAQSRRTMFLWEGATLGALALAGLALFYATVLRDARRRENQDRFLTGATHELQTPLATIRLGLESMIAGSLPPDRRGHYMQGMLREVGRLESGVRNLLAAAGLETTQMRPEPGDLTDDVRAAVDAQSPRAETAGVTLRTTEMPERCAVVRDGGAIRLVLHNLIDNAIKFSERGGEIRISLRRDAGTARLVVADDGAGIQPEDLAHIFDRFQRGSSKSTNHVGGSGLGLFLVREILQGHGGTVSAHSDGPGRGARFEITLPLSEEALAA
jgi:signal transduction histidine kinase